MTNPLSTASMTMITNCMIPSDKPIGHVLSSSLENASLEGMPSEIRLEIMLRLPNLPTLRLLRLASREYYFTARACEHSLRAVHQTRPSSWSSRRQAREGWPPRGDGGYDAWAHLNDAFLTAAREWHTDIDPMGLMVRSLWKMPGTRNFVFNKRDYIVSRIYRLTGEYPSIRWPGNIVPRTIEEYRSLAHRYHNAVDKHLARLIQRFEMLRTGCTFYPRDRDYAERMVFLYDTDLSYSSRAEQDARFWRLFDESVAERKQRDLTSLVNVAMEMKPELAVKFVEMLKEDGTLELQGDEWRVVAPRPEWMVVKNHNSLPMRDESEVDGLDAPDVPVDQLAREGFDVLPSQRQTWAPKDSQMRSLPSSPEVSTS